VGPGERFDTLLAGGRQVEPDDTLILRIVDALDQPRRDGSIDQFDDAVVAEQQMIGNIPYRRSSTVASDGEQELMLRAGEPHGSRLLLAPVLEPTQAVPERQQPLEVLIAQFATSLPHIASR
jgi:hypothetical protein